jgi:leader peptidase (prepilin peptidase)/N-methyltransferase
VPHGWPALFPLFYAAGLLVVTLTDYDLQLIPDSITLPGIVLGLVYRGWIGGAWLDSLLGVLFGGGTLWLLAEGYFRIRKREGMGGGDVKLAAMMGAFLGWKLIFAVLSSLRSRGLFGVALILLRREGDDPDSVRRLLAPVGLLALLYGDAAPLVLGLGS